MPVIMNPLSKRIIQYDLSYRIDAMLGIGKYHDPFSFRHSVILRNTELGVQMALLNMNLRTEEYDAERHFIMGCKKEKFLQEYTTKKFLIRTPKEFVSYWDNFPINPSAVHDLGAKAEQDIISYDRYRKNHVYSITEQTHPVTKRVKSLHWKQKLMRTGT